MYTYNFEQYKSPTNKKSNMYTTLCLYHNYMISVGLLADYRNIKH